ncbi:hypothetical protein [Roseibium album]|uniref:hypothetical protein n=1 Tax=Roseibium album TaxID=311410 RepID=UPI0039195BE5
MADVKQFKVHAHEDILIHNDLSNAAFHFKRSIEHRLADDERSGLSFEVMAGATMLAFANEARFNFLGYQLKGDDWDERKPAMKKIYVVLELLGLTPDFNSEPYSYLQVLKNFRDTLAHGKPEHREFSDEFCGTEEDLLNLLDLKAKWEEYLDPEFFTKAYDASEEIWKELLELAGLDLMETLSGGGSHIELIREASE